MEAHEPDIVGTVLLGKLRVVRKVGGGGMGSVYEVEHMLTRHRRALKVLHRRHAERPRFLARFLREASVAGTLDTPYVAEVYDAGQLEDGSAYVLMELLQGVSLAEHLEKQFRLRPAEIAGIICQICEGLALAHAAKIVHRDLKPENIFLERDAAGNERVKILDFGISKFAGDDAPEALTVEGTVVGTPFYMSPEQAKGVSDLDGRCDVYALGVMLYEALAGVLPFDAASTSALFIRIHEGEYTPLRELLPTVDPTLESVIVRAMHKDRDQRHQNVDALRRDLLPFAEAGAVARGRTIPEAMATRGFDEPRPTPREEKPITPMALPKAATQPSALPKAATPPSLEKSDAQSVYDSSHQSSHSTGSRSTPPLRESSPSRRPRADRVEVASFRPRRNRKVALVASAVVLAIGLAAIALIVGNREDPKPATPQPGARASDPPRADAKIAPAPTPRILVLPQTPPEATQSPQKQPRNTRPRNTKNQLELEGNPYPR